MKILHAADLHLGATFAFLGEKGALQRQQLLRTFAKITEVARQERVDLVLISGDLFDSNAPAPSVVERARSLFGELDQAGIASCLIPGTHDWYGPQSIYRAVDLSAGRQNVTVFTECRAQLFPSLGLAVYGVVPPTKSLSGDPLALIQRSADARVHIAMVHGSLYTPGLVERDDVLLREQSIAQSGLDYLALGHWHDYRELQCGPTKAVYPGAPELTSAKHTQAGKVALVTVDGPGMVSVRPIAVGQRRARELALAVDGLAVADIRAAIRAEADPDLLLQVTLRGLLAAAVELDAAALEEELREHFFHLRIRDRSATQPSVTAGDAAPTTVMGRFVQLLQERIATLEGEERDRHEEALRLGLAVLEGRQVLQ